jgi:hypothetical protein
MVFGGGTASAFGRGETTVPKPPEGDICFEFTAKKVLNLTLIITQIRYKISGDYEFEVSYSGRIGNESYKTCIKRALAADLKNEPCKANFKTQSRFEGSYGQLPTIIPFARYFKVAKKLKGSAFRWRRNQISGEWGSEKIGTDFIWGFSPGPIIDLGKDVSIMRINFSFDVTCKNNECWPCKTKGRSLGTVGQTTTDLPKDCFLEGTSQSFEGAFDFSIPASVANTTPHFHQKEEYQDMDDGGGGPVTPTYSGWSSRIFNGPIYNSINKANSELEPVDFCADMAGLEDSLGSMKDAWLDSESPNAPGGAFQEGE